MRNKSGTAFLRALAVQRRRVQQGFHSDLQGADRSDMETDPGHPGADISEMSVLLQGPGDPPPR
jgi:hypothetical protein